MSFLGFGRNNNQEPNPGALRPGQRAIGAGLGLVNPLLGLGYRAVSSYRNRNSEGGTYYGALNRSGYTGAERAAIRNAPAGQRQALIDLYRGDQTATANPALAAGMNAYQQQLGQSGAEHMQNAMNAEGSQASFALPGAAGAALQGATNQGGYNAPGGGQAGQLHRQGVSTQQQIAQLPAAMRQWIEHNGLPQTSNDIRRATNAMYLDQSVDMANSNYGQDIGFVAPQARQPRQQ